MKKKGTGMVLIDSAGAGDIISIAGMTKPSIGHTVANTEVLGRGLYYSFGCYLRAPSFLHVIICNIFC